MHQLLLGGTSYDCFLQAQERKNEYFCCLTGSSVASSLSFFQRFPMSYAIIQTGGKQYRVSEGDLLNVEKLAVDAGTETTLGEVLLIVNGDKITLGTPLVSGASVKAEVVSQFKDDKVIAFKFKRRKGYHRTVGHRRQLTKLKITKIAA